MKRPKGKETLRKFQILAAQEVAISTSEARTVRYTWRWLSLEWSETTKDERRKRDDLWPVTLRTIQQNQQPLQWSHSQPSSAFCRQTIDRSRRDPFCTHV